MAGELTLYDICMVGNYSVMRTKFRWHLYVNQITLVSYVAMVIGELTLNSICKVSNGSNRRTSIRWPLYGK